MRRAPFDDEERHHALLLPRLEPVAALLDRSPVEVAVERVEAPVAAGLVVVHRSAGVDLGEEAVDLLGVLAEAPAPVDDAARNVLLAPGHDLRVLVGLVTGLVVRGRPEDQPRDVLEALHLVADEVLVGALEPPVERLVRRRVFAGVRQAHHREHADLRGGAQRELEVRVAALREAVGAVDLRVEPVGAHLSERLLGLVVRHGRGAVHARILGAQVDRLAVEQQLAPADRHLAEAELLGVELVRGPAVLHERHAHRVDVLRAVRVPDLGVLPFAAEDLPRAGGRREGLGRERLHLPPAVVDVGHGRRVERPLAREADRELDPALRDVRADLHVVDPDARRLRGEVDVAVHALVRELLLRHGARLVGRVEDLHEALGELGRREERDLVPPGREDGREVHLAAGEERLAGAPAVHVDEHGAGDPPEAEDHAPAGPVRGDVHRPRVPRALDRVDLRAEDVGARRVVDGHAVGRVPPALRPFAGDLEEVGHLRRLRGGRDVLGLVVDLERPEAVERDLLAARVHLAPRVGHRPHRVAGGEVRNDRFGRREGAAGGQRREEGETGFRFHGDHLMTMTVGRGASSSRR